jgi:LDH2 family malate/lactate/ureidoglycolate dehydrogenase
MSRWNLADLTAWGVKALTAAGLRPADAETVVDNLAYAERRGTASHGFVRMAIYLDRIAAGGINAAFSVTTDADLGALVTVDGDAGPGQPVGRAGADLAVERAERFGLGCAIVRNTNHFGAAGQYAERIADRGYIGIVACNTNTVVSAPGGGKRVIGTNPISIALPLDPDRRPLLDMATSEVAQGKVIVAAKKGLPIPLGWAVDLDGNPTTSAEEGFKGALLPAAGPKGYGLAVMVDAILAAGGAQVSPLVESLYGDPATPQEVGLVFIALTVPAENYEATIHRFLDMLTTSRSADQDPVLFPGQPEAERAAAFGGIIDLADETVDELVTHGAALNVAFPSAVEA